jgi:glycosyltransferase involved in cell wall biosynthesis
VNKISIVTPSLNQGAFVDEMLESVRSQNYPDVEHIVVDGGSSDETLPLLSSKSGAGWDHLRWTSEHDGGQTQALNKGFRQATGSIIGWLNADDRYRPGCFEIATRIFAENPDVDVIYGDYTFMDEKGIHLRVRREIAFNRLVLLHHHMNYIPTTSTFFRRRIFDDDNWLDESLQYAMDHEFYLRLAARGYRFKHVPAVFADFRIHATSKTCARPERAYAESRIARQRYSPVASGVKNKALRAVSLGALRTAAAAARYGEKLIRGYYLPERLRPVR